VLALGLLAAPLFLACSEQGAEVSQVELLRRLDSGERLLVLDVRSPEEFAQGHVPGAVNISHSEIAQRMDELAPFRETDVILYCERGVRAAKAEAALRAAGFESVLHLNGDMSSWRRNGRPVALPE
jgi:rhodanese-related sulfurtransferase